MDNEECQLGDIVEDTITGFRGVAIGVTKWLHGCRRITVQPESLDKSSGKPKEPGCFDEPQLKLIRRKQHATTGKRGGPRPDIGARPEVRR